MLTVQLRSRALSQETVKGLLSKHLPRTAMALQVRGATTIFKPDGTRLLTYLPGALSSDAAGRAYPFLHWMRHYISHNRGKYGGGVTQPRILPDGSATKTRESAPVRSAVVGYFDRYPRMPFCRELAFTSQDPEAWGECQPMIQEVAKLFAQHVPDRYAAQLSAAKRAHPAYVIPSTPFTTLTVNNCVAGTLHTDKGDYGPGFGVIAVLRKGAYRGAELVFPAYGCGADLGHGDVILFDPHEPHTNLPFLDTVGPEGEPEQGGYERISIVFYFRERMLECLSPAEERERAKGLRGSLEAVDDSPLEET